MISLTSLHHNQNTGLLLTRCDQAEGQQGSRKCRNNMAPVTVTFSPYYFSKKQEQDKGFVPPSHFSLHFQTYLRKCDDSRLGKGCTISVFTSTKSTLLLLPDLVLQSARTSQALYDKQISNFTKLYKIPLYSTKKSKGMEPGFWDVLKVAFSMLTTLIS